MKKFKFTDNDRFVRPYVPASMTNISKTFAAVRARIEVEKRMRAASNVRDLSDVFGKKNNG